MRIRTLLAVVGLRLLLTACGDPQPQKKEPAAPPPPPPAPTYHVTTFKGDDVVREFEATNVTLLNDAIQFRQPQQGRDSTIAGTAIVTHKLTSARNAGTIKYRATLYGFDKVLGTWDVESYNFSNGVLRITAPGATDWTDAIQGTWTLEALNKIPAPNGTIAYKIGLFSQTGKELHTWVAQDVSPTNNHVNVTLPGLQNTDLVVSGNYVIEPYSAAK